MEKNEIVLHKAKALTIFWRQLKSPLLLILFVATVVSFFLAEKTSALVILATLGVSVFLGFINEFMAEKTVADLLRRVSPLATIIKNDKKEEIPARDLKINDLVWLVKGNIVPADLKLISQKGLEVDEAVLTGEGKPTEKKLGDSLFMGTTVVSGLATAQVVAIGSKTKLGKIALDAGVVKQETDFQKGLRSFGNLLVRVIFIMTLVIFVVNAFLGHSPINSLLFALAIAVGITPELLPLIVTVSLSYGARQLAKKEVVVKQLVAIEDLGNMEVLCTDKTGTLTEGKIALTDYFSLKKEQDERVLKLGLICNGAVVGHRIFGDAIDTAIWEYAKKNNIFSCHSRAGGNLSKIDPRVKPEDDMLAGVVKIQEEPFDFEHRAMFTAVEDSGPNFAKATLGRQARMTGNQILFIYKGSFEAVVKVCKLKEEEKKYWEKRYLEFSGQGKRVVAVAEKKIDSKSNYSFSDANNLTFLGFLIFNDVCKKQAREAIERLKKLGVQVKIVTGDNEIVTKQVCQQVDVPCEKVILGDDLAKMDDAKLRSLVWKIDAFCKTTPEQKLRVISALQFGGHSVGFLGDGVNDAPALHAADVGVSVNSGVDVAKDTASIVLLRKSLDVIAEAVKDGRKIFNNTMKYILMDASSNFGNMFSAAGASFLLPFLPMTPAQILLNNALYDASQISIPTDNVDSQDLIRPKKWDINLIKRYMMFFGPISSMYDFATFGVMLYFFHARGALFQTGWFLESLLTQILVVFIIRTKKSFWQSRPSWQLVLGCFLVVGLGFFLPFSPVAHIFGFLAPPPAFLIFIAGLTMTYLMIVEWGKKFLNKV
ncbi:MAG: magnesium-translocating P-type ATPase [Patescibacteria group bacterium]|nr:magnesium-translocating P-type ATPase [Patescibacteria group bacterium]